MLSNLSFPVTSVLVRTLLVGLVGSFSSSALPAQSPPSIPAEAPAQASSSTTGPANTASAPAKTQTADQAAKPLPATVPATPAKPSHYQPNRFAGRAGEYYRLVWGVDSLSVKWTESGEVIRFSYRVLDADKAKALNEKKSEPSLMDPKAGVKLVVPSLEKVGQLRQTATPEAGKAYWMAFSNKGRLVKRGDHVDVVIGPFKAEGLVVD
jgi:hypothetical protein